MQVAHVIEEPRRLANWPSPGGYLHHPAVGTWRVSRHTRSSVILFPRSGRGDTGKADCNSTVGVHEMMRRVAQVTRALVPETVPYMTLSVLSKSHHEPMGFAPCHIVLRHH